MEYGAHGAASGEGAESSSFIVYGKGIDQDMSHAELKAICCQAAGGDVEVEMCCKVDTNTQYAFVECKTRDSVQAIQNLKNPELESVIWKSMTKHNYWMRLSKGRPSHEYEVCVGGLSTQSPKELEKVCTSFGKVQEVVMYGNYAFVYFNTEDSAKNAIMKKDRMVTPQENKKDQKEQRIIAIAASMNKLSIKNLPICLEYNELKSTADEAGPGVLKCYITEDTYSYDKDGLIEYRNQACAEYGKKRIKSTEKLRQHKVTGTFERPTMQEKQDFISYTIGDEKSYIDFIKGLRDKLVHRDTSGVVEDIFKDDSNRGAHRVLDKFQWDNKVQWIRIELRAGQEGKESTTTLAVRKHNVYIKGFTGTKDGRRKWLELPEGDKEDDGMKLPRSYKAEKLDGWSVSYNGLMKLNDLEQVKKTLSNTRLGKAFAERAVGRLSRYPDDNKANNDDIPVRLAMAGLIVMICEAARMNPCLDAIAGGWTRGTGLTTRMKDIIWDWSNMSAALLKWKEVGYRKWPSQRTDSPGHALSSVYLVLNTNAKIKGDNKVYVEIFSVKVNFPSDGMTVKVFHGENDAGHIIYEKEKQQGEQEKAAASSGGQPEMLTLELIKPGKCSSANEWFGISVNDGDSSSSTKFKWPCREQDEPVTELVTRKIEWPCRKQDGRDTEPATRKMDITYLVMSGAVKATVKVRLKVDTTEPDSELHEKKDISTEQAKKQYIVRGTISAVIGDYESHQIMLLSPGNECNIDQIDRDKLVLSLPRKVIVPYGRHQLRIKMSLTIRDDSNTQVVDVSDVTVIFNCNINSSDGTSSFNILDPSPSATSGIEVDVITSPTQTKEMEDEAVWTIGNGNQFTVFIEKLRDIWGGQRNLKDTERSLLIKRYEKEPLKWFHIKLQLEGEETSITLAIRDDILFGAGFMNQAGVWYSLIRPGREAIKLLGEQYNSVSLNWGRTYSELVKPGTLNVVIEKLGKDFVTGAVRTLSRYPDVEDGDQPSLALAGLSVVFCESAIWENLKEHFSNVWEMKDDIKTEYREPQLEEYIHYWRDISRDLQTKVDVSGSMTLPASIKQNAGKYIRLLYNDPPAQKPSLGINKMH